jgi:hypothetical protein
MQGSLTGSAIHRESVICEIKTGIADFPYGNDLINYGRCGGSFQDAAQESHGNSPKPVKMRLARALGWPLRPCLQSWRTVVIVEDYFQHEFQSKEPLC